MLLFNCGETKLCCSLGGEDIYWSRDKAVPDYRVSETVIFYLTFYLI